jgi:type IV pilus assembly protein PilC
MQTTIDLEQLLRTPRFQKKAQAKSSLLEWAEQVLRHRITDRQRADFCLQLSVMLRARVSLHRALEALALQASSPRLKKIIDGVQRDIQKGSSFSRSLRNQPQIFDTMFVTTAEVGEETGRLPEVLSHLADHLEKIGGLKRKFYQAMAYPALVMSVACFAVMFLLVFIVPTFAEMFRSMQLELPLSTRIILSISESTTRYGPFAVGAVIVGTVLFWGTIRTRTNRDRVEAMSLRLPFLGGVLVKNHIARFCRTLGTLLHAQVSLIDALETTLRVISLKPLQEEVREIIRQVQQGRAVAEPVIRSKYFPPMVAQMIAVGEETSELDSMLLKVADYYEKDLDSTVETLSTVIEPVLILVLGLVVGAILVSMYLPMFDLVNVVGGG